MFQAEAAPEGNLSTGYIRSIICIVEILAYNEQPGDTKARSRSQVRLLILYVSNEHRSRSHSNDGTHMSTHNNHLHAINKWMISYKSHLVN